MRNIYTGVADLLLRTNNKKAVVEKSPSQEVWEHIQAHYTPQPGPVDLTFLSKKSPSLRWGMNCSCNFSYF